MSTKLCRKCNETKPLSEFYRKPSNPNGIDSNCKTCNKNRAKAWQRKHPDKQRQAAYGRNYGMTIDEFNTMVVDQDGVCAICKKPDSNSRLHIDHNHEFNFVRGLLCGKCNRAIGLLDENINLLQAAIDYLVDRDV